MERDKLIALVRKQAGFKLDADDPVLAVVAINEVLFEAALAKLDQSVIMAVDRMAAMNVQNEVAAKRAASDVINGASDWLTTKFKEVAQEATAGMLAELRQETAKAEAASRMAVRAAWTVGAIGAAAASLMVGYGIAGL